MQETNEQLKEEGETLAVLQTSLQEKKQQEQRSAQSIAALEQSNIALRANITALQQQVQNLKTQEPEKKNRKHLGFLLMSWLLLLLIAVGTWWIWGDNVTTNQDNTAQLSLNSEASTTVLSSALDTIEQSDYNNALSIKSEQKNKASSITEPSLVRLNFSPNSTEIAMSDFLDMPNSTYPKTFWMRKIYFEKENDLPHPSSSQQIDNVATLMKRYSNMTIRIYGEVADSVDKAIGIQQANTIKTLFHQKGIAKNRMLTAYIIKKSIGNSNRRIEIEILNRG